MSDTVEEINKLQNIDKPQSPQKSPAQHDQSIVDEAERIVAHLSKAFPEKFEFQTDREAYMHLGVRQAIQHLKLKYLTKEQD